MKRIYNYCRAGLLSCLLLLAFDRSYGQVTITDIAACNTYTLTAHVTGTLPTASGIDEDDVWSAAIPIGFTYNFYGSPYTQCIIGANGLVGFQLSEATAGNTWSIDNMLALSVATDIRNCICGPWCDIYVPAGGTINYSMQGTAPNRSFAVTFCHDAMFSCTTEWITTQIIIYETSGLAEVHIGHRTICTDGWNGSHAIVGVKNAAGTSTTVAPGRDYPTVWAASDEAWRFTPDATGATYTVSSIPYAPIPYAASAIYWFDSTTGAYVGMGDSIEVDPTVTTTYRGVAVGCGEDSVNAYIHLLPGSHYCFNATNNGPVCISDTLKLGAHGDSTAATYTWYGPLGFTGTGQSTFRTGLTMADTGVYYVVKNVAGVLDTTSTDVSLKPLPTVTATSNSPVCGGGTNVLLLFANPDSTGETFTWIGPDGFTSTLQNATDTGAAVSGSGFYTVYTSLNGCNDSGSVFVKIDSTPALPTLTTNAPICSKRDTLKLFATDATPDVSYSWTGPAGFTSAARNPVLLPDVHVPASGTYNMTATLTVDGHACANSSSIAVAVDSTPYAPLLGSNSAICSGVTLTLTASSTALSNYSWWGPNAFTSGLQNPSVTGAPTVASGTYFAAAYIIYPGIPRGCVSDTSSTVVEVDSTPAAPVASSNSPGPPGPIICQGDTLRLSSSDATAGVGYNWAGPDAFTSTLQNPIFAPATPASTGSYTLTASLGACSSLAIITVSVTPTPPLTATNNGPICTGISDTLLLQATSGPGATYSWAGPYTFSSANQNPFRTPVIFEYGGVYQVTAFVAGCASAVINDTVVVRQTPNPPAVAWLTYCQGYPAAPLQAMGDSILWYPTDTAYGIGSLTAPVPSTGSLGVSWFFVSQTLMNCTSYLDSVRVTVNPKPTVTVTSDTAVCPHDTVLLTAVDTDPLAYYHWAPLLYITDTSSASIISRPEATVTYTVVASNQFGCTDTAKTTITVQAAAVIDLGDSVKLYPGQSYQLNPQTNCSVFSWSPPDGLSDPHISSPLAAPGFSTIYTVNGVTSWGCVATASISIYVDDQSVLMLPNAFSPGNGPDNVFKIIKEGEATLNYFRIFDRWGVKVFETTDISQGWDGSFNGKPQPFGVYVYEISAMTNSGTVINKHGNVTLLR